MTDGKDEIIIYDEIQGKPRIEVKLADETLWLSQRLMAELFEKDVDTISLHIKNIYTEAELEEGLTTSWPLLPYYKCRVVSTCATG
jgi:hypothetical protein